MNKQRENLIIGVDGGGTKTESWAVDFNGKIIGKAITGPSNLRNSGIKDSVESIVSAIKKSITKKKQREIKGIVIGIASLNEEYKDKKNLIKKEIIKSDNIFNNLKDKITITSDQEIAFKSGTNEKNGIVVVSGTGCVVRGWKDGKDVKVSGWGWLADEGSACWVGQKTYQLLMKIIDGRLKKSLLISLAKNKLNVKNAEQLNKLIYSQKAPQILSELSLISDLAANKKDKYAINILKQASQELLLSVLTVNNQLKFKEQFPLVLIGGMFNSKIMLNSFKKEIKKNKINAKILMPKKPPVYGAIKLAKEKYEKS